MRDFKLAMVFTLFGFLLASLAGSLSAAPDKTPGMALMSARVGGNSNLAGGAGAVSAERAGPKGQYKVTFKRDLSPACTATATISGGGALGEQGFIVASKNASGTLLVRTYDKNGDFDDHSFDAIVYCDG